MADGLIIPPRYPLSSILYPLPAVEPSRPRSVRPRGGFLPAAFLHRFFDGLVQLLRAVVAEADEDLVDLAAAADDDRRRNPLDAVVLHHLAVLVHRHHKGEVVVLHELLDLGLLLLRVDREDLQTLV